MNKRAHRAFIKKREININQSTQKIKKLDKLKSNMWFRQEIKAREPGKEEEGRFRDILGRSSELL